MEETTERPVAVRATKPICCVCSENESKYRCPKCDARTCSAACSSSHKSKTGCTGKRPRTEFIRLGEFDDRHLVSDFNFLEDVKRSRDLGWRTFPLVGGFVRWELPRHKKKLEYEARKRGVTMRFLARGMKRSRVNSSSFDFTSKNICWSVEWRFVGTDVRILDRRIGEKRIIEDVLGKHLSVDGGTEGVLHKLQKFLRADGGEIKILMKKEGRPADKDEYYVINKEKSIEEELGGKLLIEFPIFLVVMGSDIGGYNVVEGNGGWGTKKGVANVQGDKKIEKNEVNLAHLNVVEMEREVKKCKASVVSFSERIVVEDFLPKSNARRD